MESKIIPIPIKRTMLKSYVLLILVLFSVGLNAQVTVAVKKQPLKEILKVIETKSEYRFFYNEGLKGLDKITSLEVNNVTINQAMTTLLSNTGIGFKIEKKNLIVLVSETKDNENSLRNVSGIITDQNDEPIIGASILDRNTKTGTITDVNGNFTLKVSDQSILVVSYIGYSSLEVKVGSQRKITIKLKESAINLDDVVVIGYGTQKKSDNSGAVAVLNNQKFNKGLTSSPEQLLNGKVAGIQVLTTNGEPGSAPSIRIRGNNSITASSEPLYVIDGVPVDNNRSRPNLNANSDNGLNNASMNPLVMLSADDIETMTVLKDASATAIYGSRGANGVIMITTKKGVAGDIKLSYDGSFGVSNLPSKLDVLSAADYKSAVTAKGLTATFGNANTDWQDQIFRTAYTQSHNVAFSGGNQSTQYRVSFGVQDQQGIIIGTDMNRYNARVSLVQNFKDRLKFQFNLANSNYNSNNLIEQQTGGFRGGVLNNVFKMDPTQPVTKADGTYSEYSNDVRNPVALQNQIIDKTEGNRVIGNLETELVIFSDLKAKLNLAYDRDAQERNVYQPIISSIGKDVSGRAINNKVVNGSKLLEFYLTYDKKLGNHKINLLGGYSWQEYNNQLTTTLAEGFSNDNLTYNSMDVTGQKSININNEANRLISYFGRVNYTLLDRYIVTATLRTDGSSRFGKNNQYGLFPSAALAWRINSEKWLENVTFISNLKARVGIGGTGNQEIGNYRFMSTLSVSQLGGASFGNSYYARYNATTIPNPDLQWEQTTQSNFGIDFGFLKQRIYGTIDLYNKNTTKLLVELVAIQPAVSSVYLNNIGEMTNKGIEFSIGGVIVEKKDLQWNVDFNISSNKNQITKLYAGSDIHTGTVSGAGAPGQGIQIIREGEAYGSFYGYEYLGLGSDGKEKFTDIDKNGVIDDKDKKIIGDALPKATMGLSTTAKYKSFDLNVAFRAAVGNQIYNNTRAEISQPNRLPGQNVSPEGAAGLAGSAYNYSSSRWLENGDFLRLDNLTIGYNFKFKLGTQIKARVYCTGQNLFVITKYSGYDPEVNTNAGNSSASSVGIDYNNYPKARTFTVGVNINL